MQKTKQSKAQRLYNVEQASEYLGGVSPHTLRKKIQRGEVRIVRLGRRTMIAQEEIDRISRQGWSPLRHVKAEGRA
jgi:excisionase family DNA binding protein